MTPAVSFAKVSRHFGSVRAVDAVDAEIAAGEFFAMLAKGALVPEIGQRFALNEAAVAHRALEAGKTTGSTVLVP